MSAETEAEVEQQLFGEQVSYFDRLPLDLEPLSLPLTSAQRERLAARNVSVLRAVGVLEEHRGEPEDRTGTDGELARLDLKLNLVVELLGVVINMQRPLPPDQEVRLSHRGLSWTSDRLLAQPGDSVLVSLFLHACSAQAVQWDARLLASRDEGDGIHRCWAAFETMPDAMLKYLERLIFRHHRRQIAEERGSS